MEPEILLDSWRFINLAESCLEDLFEEDVVGVTLTDVTVAIKKIVLHAPVCTGKKF